MAANPMSQFDVYRIGPEIKVGELDISFTNASLFMILSTELISAVAVGTIIGFIFDKTFGTKPWFILIFFFVGVVAGIANVIRSAKNMQK